MRIRDVNEMQQTSVMQKIKHEKKGDKYNTVDETQKIKTWPLRMPGLI